MIGPAVRPALARAWDQHCIWSLTASRLKQRLDRSRAGALALGLAAAVLAVVASQVSALVPEAGRAAGVAATTCAGFATMLQRRATTDKVRAWTRARSAAEQLKTEVYSDLAGGSTVAHAIDRDAELNSRTARLLEDVADLQHHTAGITADRKPLPAVANVGDYITERLEAQINGFYRPKAAIYDTRVRRLRAVGTTLGVATVILSALATGYGLSALGAWVPVATTAGASLTAHITAARYDHLIIEYLRTAQQLENLRDGHKDAPGTDAEFIDACENVISVENQGWMTRWNTDDTGTTPQNE
ncbi:DUF4231 domain-containing protein [Arthrobacter oryzae]|uniref:Uncharacterized protein DUF4231 n=1 Tax=Arthrobacter oryzae TaxID=409290 RepID=A0A495E9V6_9MICC|nr:DUF4231 domain-containing protein [Arthrobacter oryzae]RKR13714.1 uncharacterized protein DUF4231 [Arthrobacter oryzae]